MKKRLVTSALPYVNNVPHLGNIIQVLSADVFARFCRMRGYETLYVCGTDEYGTATETRAKEEGISPRELCDRYFAIHRDIYSWFDIAFDHFGRTSRPVHSEITQGIFKEVHRHGFISEQTIEQLYSEKSDMFLADRYVKGTCPHCSYTDARGDQCESCGKLLDPMDLINPISLVDSTVPVVRATRHLYIKLPELKDRLEAWVKEASQKGNWAHNAIQMTQSWIRDGLKERAITRDLKWGIPVPLAGFESKVFYVWFDAPIGYISITADYTPDWKSWWKNPDEVELFQFIGKDNIPFHTVIFPSSQLATGENWTMLHHMSSTEYLNYENQKFSKSKGIGVFGNDCVDTGIPADVWRFYIFLNRPESSDFNFTWKDFLEKVNKELIGNLSNLVNRVLSFWAKSFPGEIPSVDTSSAWSGDFWKEVVRREGEIAGVLEWAELRSGLREILELSSYGNKIFQDNEPWKLMKSDPSRAREILSNLLFLIRDLGVLVHPYMPGTSKRILAFLGLDPQSVAWASLGKPEAHIRPVQAAELLFTQLDPKHIESLREKFSGSQNDRKVREDIATAMNASPESKGPEAADAVSVEASFAAKVELRAAKITAIERHPEAERLYIETLDDGGPEPRTIVSGLVPHYAADELLGKTILVVANLKPAKLRGVMSNGMLLAASGPAPDGTEKVEVIFTDAAPGTTIEVEGFPAGPTKAQITIDAFFELPIRAESHEVKVGDARLLAGGVALSTKIVKEGKVG